MDKIKEKIEPVVLPKDNGPHDFTVEWWYFNGHLYDKKGIEYSFMDCFFKVNAKKVNIPHILPHLIEDHLKNGDYIHFAHSVISDISKKKSYKEVQNISLISKESFKKDLLFIEYKNTNIFNNVDYSKIIETAPNCFHLENKYLNLDLRSRKSPLLEGGHGYVGTPESGSYYYSLTDMVVKGKIMVNKKEIEVEGRAWMDHQWANAIYKKDRWTWFSFHLNNGTEIMCVEYDTMSGTDILINTIDKDGKQNQYKKANIISGKKFYESKKTKAKYPLSWKIEIEEANIEIETSSLIDEEEIIFGPINYWEGPMKVKAKINGEEIKGKGFMELVGYPSDYNYLLVEGETLLEKIKNLFTD